MPKDNSSKPVYTRFDAIRDELKAVYYGSSVLTQRSNAKNPAPKKVTTPSNTRTTRPIVPRKTVRHSL